MDGCKLVRYVKKEGSGLLSACAFSKNVSIRPLFTICPPTSLIGAKTTSDGKEESCTSVDSCVESVPGT
eukprot:11594318-Ditylum_brightwellii.AAC.1